MAGKHYLSSDPATAGLLRWLPPVIVLGVMTGFVALSWYAYHAGTQSLQNGHLLVVQADKEPVKEKPMNAGGMQFPDQDKTIFDTFSANPKPLPKVERVLPMPEEPVATPENTSGTVGWINDKPHQKSGNTQVVAQAAPEQLIAPAGHAAPKKQDVIEAVKKPIVAGAMPAEEFRSVNTALPNVDQTTLYVAKQTENLPVTPPAAPPKASQKKIAAAATMALPAKTEASHGKQTMPVKKPLVSTAATKEIDAIVGSHEKVSKGAFKVQLGAYRSEKEALAAWKGMQKKHAALKAMSPSIVRADLGAKGTYYRLRAAGFSSSSDAKGFCGKLKAVGQACLIASK